MRRRASRTAEWVCLFRALEALRPPSARIVHDPLAEHFLPRRYQPLLASARRSPWLAARIERLVDPGLMSFVLARHRSMDDGLLHALAHGAEQVLILGAGYDTRAWRFAHQLGGRPIFEVDHPATSARKAARAATLGELPPVDLRRVPVDFLRDDLVDRLRAAGFQRRRTFTIWEGVTMYLEEEAVQATLRAVRQLVTPGSEIMADLWDRSPTGTTRDRLFHLAEPLFGAVGEPLRFHLDPVDAPRFFGACGWHTVTCIPAASLQARYVRDNRRLLPVLYVVRSSAGDSASRGGGSGKM